jgi:hypothetical protein
MDVKQAVVLAKRYIADLLADEGVINLGLEEIDRDDTAGVWHVTLGFSRPWNSVRNALTALTGDVAAKRSYRIVTVRDLDGEVLSVKRRDPQDN